jgi:hypothetical protein
MSPEFQTIITKFIVALDIFFMIYFVTKEIKEDLNG